MGGVPRGGILFGDVRIATLSAILLNATMMVGAGLVIVTPDAPLMVTSAFVLLFQAKVLQTGRGVWWLAVGAAVGCALVSKYTALFFGAQILLWLLLAKDMRRWLASPWPYLGGALAFAIFSPVVLWNADHQWVSFIKQLGRARVEGMTLKFLAETIPAQIAFATPSVFILGVFGLYALLKRDERTPDTHAAARTLINTSFWIIFIYFIWHSLHARVEANWLGPVYPAFSIAAAYAAFGRTWAKREQRTIDLSRRWALPIGVVLFIALIVQTNTGIFTGFRRDPSVRAVAVGWPELAKEIEATRIRIGASCVVAEDYGTTSLLAFYLPKGTCVAQRNQRIRWVNMPEPEPALLMGKLLLVGDVYPDGPIHLASKYERIEKLTNIERKRSGVPVEIYQLALLDTAKGDLLDRSPRPELGGPAR